MGQACGLEFKTIVKYGIVRLKKLQFTSIIKKYDDALRHINKAIELAKCRLKQSFLVKGEENYEMDTDFDVVGWV